MRCEYCQKDVVGHKDVVVLVGRGPVHQVCYERTLVSRRIFQGLALPNLSLDDFAELKELVLQEINSRTVHAEVELF